MTTLQDIPKDVTVSLAIDMKYRDIISLCKVSKKFNESICKNMIFWKLKIKKDFNLNFDENVGKTPQEFYKTRIIKIIKDYSSLITMASKLSHLRKDQILILPNGIRFKTTTLFQLFDKFIAYYTGFSKEDFHLLKDNLKNIVEKKDSDKSAEIFINIFG